MANYSMVRYSGLRIPQEPPLARSNGWASLLQAVKPLHGVLQAMLAEPLCMDDWLRECPPDAILSRLLNDGEVFTFWKDGQFFGVGVLYAITLNRSAYLTVYAMPEFRKSRTLYRGAKDLIAYAFKPAPEGLGLAKIKAEIAESNTSSLRGAQVLGFVPVGCVSARWFVPRAL